MGLFDAIIGNASQVDYGKIAVKLEGILLPDEEVSLAYKLVRDFFVFTERRFMIVDVQGFTGRKVEYLSLSPTALSPAMRSRLPAHLISTRN
jgi:hypothetical protein